VTAPGFAFWSTDNSGEWIVEQHGVDPDYVVSERPDLVVSGHDPQLEKAIELAKEALKNRSEEHTSELQSPCNLVCRLLLENKNKKSVQPEPQRLRRLNRLRQSRELACGAFLPQYPSLRLF